MKLSVIIPTYNRPRMLLQCLNSLQTQTLPKFEIIVADNAADYNIKNTIKDFNQSAQNKALYISEPDIGLHNARHSAAHVATGDVLVFTDDDATFDPDWLTSYSRAFSAHADMAAAGGPVRPIWEASPPKWIIDYMENKKMLGILSLMEPYNTFRLDHTGSFFGVNMAIRQKILFEVGGFNPESFGDIWLGDGESGLNYKLWNLGLLIGYIPEAIVYHHIPEKRMTVKYFCHRMANQGACDMYTRFHSFIPGTIPLSLHAVSIFFTNILNWIRAFWVRGHTEISLLNLQTNAWKSLAEFKYLLRLIYDKAFRELVIKQNWLGPKGPH